MRPASREDAGLTVISSHRYSLAGADAGSTLTVSDSIFIDNRAVGGDGNRML